MNQQSQGSNALPRSLVLLMFRAREDSCASVSKVVPMVIVLNLYFGPWDGAAWGKAAREAREEGIFEEGDPLWSFFEDGIRGDSEDMPYWNSLRQKVATADPDKSAAKTKVATAGSDKPAAKRKKCTSQDALGLRVTMNR